MAKDFRPEFGSNGAVINNPAMSEELRERYVGKGRLSQHMPTRGLVLFTILQIAWLMAFPLVDMWLAGVGWNWIARSIVYLVPWCLLSWLLFRMVKPRK